MTIINSIYLFYNRQEKEQQEEEKEEQVENFLEK